MGKLKRFKIQLVYTLSILMLSSFFYLSGCGSDTVTNNQQTGPDTNVVVFDTIMITQWNNNNSLSSADLYSGKAVLDLSTTRDIQMRSLNGANVSFSFRDGTFLNPAGYECRFKQMYTGNDNFDTVSVIPGGLELANFPDQKTDGYGYFSASSNQHMVIGFYLKGKFDHAVTAHPIYGVLYLMYGAGGGGFSNYNQYISVRINKQGENHFKR